MQQIIFSFDTEDFVTPESDDALKAIARILRRRGIRASFALVGDKARALWTRHRKDVIDEVRWHDIQYHANTHMMWPVTTLELSRMKWDEGVDFVMQTERHGIEDVAEVFDQRPRAYIRCGGNWDPRELYGMHLLGIEAHVPSRATLPAGIPDAVGAGLSCVLPAWYVNVLNYGYNFPIERYFRPEFPLARLRADFTALRQALTGKPIPIVVYAHPCTFVTSKFYDLHNQRRRGVFPTKEKWRPAPLLPPYEARRRLAVLDELARWVTSQRDLKIITHSEFIDAHREKSRWLPLHAVVALARTVLTDDLHWCQVGRGYLSPAEVFGALSLALVAWRREGTLPKRLPVRRLIGPPESARALSRAFPVPAVVVADACAQVEREIDLQHRMPAAVTVRGQRVPPASFLTAMAKAVLQVSARGGGNVTVGPRAPFPRCQAELFAEVKVGSSELPQDFKPGTITTYTHLQTWTMRPATPQRG